MDMDVSYSHQQQRSSPTETGTDTPSIRLVIMNLKFLISSKIQLKAEEKRIFYFYKANLIFLHIFPMIT